MGKSSCILYIFIPQRQGFRSDIPLLRRRDTLLFYGCDIHLLSRLDITAAYLFLSMVTLSRQFNLCLLQK